MKRRRISDREIRDEILHFSRYGTVGECLTDLLRCRRALRRIDRLLADQGSRPNPQDVRDAYWAAVEALGKGETV